MANLPFLDRKYKKFVPEASVDWAEMKLREVESDFADFERWARSQAGSDGIPRLTEKQADYVTALNAEREHWKLSLRLLQEHAQAVR